MSNRISDTPQRGSVSAVDKLVQSLEKELASLREFNSRPNKGAHERYSFEGFLEGLIENLKEED